MESRDQITKKFIKEYEKLTDEQKKAVCWFVANMEITEELSQGEKIPHGKMVDLIETAKSREDYVMLLLLLYKQRVDKNGREKV